MGKRKKHLYFISRAAVGRGDLPSTVDAFSFAKPALSNPERAVLLLDACRAKHAGQRFEMFAIPTDAMPSARPFGDNLSDEQFLETFED